MIAAKWQRAERAGDLSIANVAVRYAKKHGVSLAEAGRRFDLSKQRMGQKWREIFGGVPPPPDKVLRDRAARDKQIVALARQRLSASEIARALKVNAMLVCVARDRLGIAMWDGNRARAVRRTRVRR